MKFLIYMSICNLIIPITMSVIGVRYKKKYPSKINPNHGYRTRMSMINEDTWVFAQKELGKYFKYAAIVLYVLYGVCFIFMYGKNSDAVGYISLIEICLQMLVMCWGIYFVETKLKKTFDIKGARK